MSARVLVTGGAGYVGSAVVAALLDAGHRVAVFDNLTTGHADTLAGLDLEIVRGDLADRSAIENALRRFGAEAVVHVAGSIQAGESMADPGKYYRNNVVNSINLLDGMVANGVQRFVFSSSAGVYGDPVRLPIEEADPLSPTNTYGETKLAIERAATWYGRAHGLRSVFLRYFNAAGATERLGESHDPETHIIPLALRVALGQAVRFPIFGTDYATPDGTAIRDYVHVADLAHAHALALDAADRAVSVAASDSPPGQAFNLGSGSGFSNRQVVETCRKVTGHPIPTIELPRRPGDPAVLVANPRRAIDVLGWQPRFADLESIVASAWAWHQQHPHGYAAAPQP
ncbi:MAG TPA: UDP-glucose 4-epimerase GalE [Chloroflexota bacterium]|nr:UDP-glucose 4-epimerase GalE [Chloroflexota bacterium]